MKSKAVLIWVLGVFFTAVGVFVYLILGEPPLTESKIKLSYFGSEQEVARAVAEGLGLEIGRSRFYWVGLEPGRSEQFIFLLKLKEQITAQQVIQRVIVDSELGLSTEQQQQLGVTDVVLIKENLFEVGEKLQQLEKSEEGYFLVTASIYSTSVIEKNPINKMKDQFALKPLTFSLAYLATDSEDEKNLLFSCRTDDNTGTAAWGCLVTNRARGLRRHLKAQQGAGWMGLVDASSERDYVLLLKSKLLPQPVAK